MTWPHRYIGSPYSATGLGGYNCWTLVRAVLQRELGVEVPAYGDTSAKDLARVAHTMAEDSLREPWVKIDQAEAREFDVVLMVGRVNLTNGTTRRIPVHVGIMVDRYRMVHIEEGINCVMVRLTHPSVRFRISRIYRHRILACPA